MRRWFRGLATVALLPVLAAGQQARAETGTDPQPAISQTAEQRIGGADRYQVAANISRWLPGGDGSKVVVASGEVFPDALSVGPLAAKLGARLLLTRGSSIPDTVRSELARRSPQEILIAGGPGTVSTAVETELAAIAPVTRIGGADRYAVAAGVSERFQSTEVVIASGELFSDALSAGPLAAKLGAPLLLARTDALPQATADALARLAPQTITVLGGPDTVGDEVVAEMARLTGASTVRIGGADRYEVAAGVATRYFSDAKTAVLASGLVFPDGLSGTPLAHAYSAPILLSKGTCAPSYTLDALAALPSPAHRVYLGGPSSVTSGPFTCGGQAFRPSVLPPKADLTAIMPGGTPAEEAVYFVPHQDDELISMAGGIVRDVAAGRRVHVFLISAGDQTGVKQILCQVEGRCLTDNQIIASRDAEVLDSLGVLGVPATNVHFMYIREEQSDAASVIHGVVDEVVRQGGPNVHYRSISWLDEHPTHYEVAYALRDNCTSAGLGDCQFFQSPLYQKLATGMKYSPVVSPKGERIAIPDWQVPAATAAYRLDAPAKGRHSIGWRSVASQIKWVEDNRYSWGHGLVWASSSDEAEAAAWIRKNQGATTSTAQSRPSSDSAPFPMEEDFGPNQ